MDKWKEGGVVIMEAAFNMKDAGWRLIALTLNDCTCMNVGVRENNSGAKQQKQIHIDCFVFELKTCRKETTGSCEFKLESSFRGR